MNTQFATSATVRPQPRQTSSKVVEHTATQGVSGRFAGDDLSEDMELESEGKRTRLTARKRLLYRACRTRLACKRGEQRRPRHRLGQMLIKAGIKRALPILRLAVAG
jgi:hypothetical protein